MTATTTSRIDVFRGYQNQNVTLPALASTRYLKGVIVVVDANGRASAPAAGLHAMGLSIAVFDNSAGANDDLNVQVQPGLQEVFYSGTAPIPGDVVYVLDNQTVTLTAGTNGVAGAVTQVNAADSKCTVAMGPTVVASIVGA